MWLPYLPPAPALSFPLFGEDMQKRKSSLFTCTYLFTKLIRSNYQPPAKQRHYHLHISTPLYYELNGGGGGKYTQITVTCSHARNTSARITTDSVHLFAHWTCLASPTGTLIEVHFQPHWEYCFWCFERGRDAGGGFLSLRDLWESHQEA